MDKLLEQLAETLGKTTYGVAGAISTLKEATPDIYQKLITEYSLYNVLNRLTAISMGISVISIIMILVITEGFYYEYSDLARSNKIPLKIAYITLPVTIIVFILSVTLSPLLAPNIHLLLKLLGD